MTKKQSVGAADDPQTRGLAEQLIRHGYYQISIAHRTVARLPSGKSGREALAEACGRTDAWEWAYMLGEGAATDQYLRCYADEPLRKTLDAPTWAAFKKAGGRTCR